MLIGAVNIPSITTRSDLLHFASGPKLPNNMLLELRVWGAKCERSGARLVLVDPACTSQTCQACRHCSPENRKPSGFPLHGLRIYSQRRLECGYQYTRGRQAVTAQGSSGATSADELRARETDGACVAARRESLPILQQPLRPGGCQHGPIHGRFTIGVTDCLRGRSQMFSRCQAQSARN
jgi:hypothetical protein